MLTEGHQQDAPSTGKIERSTQQRDPCKDFSPPLMLLPLKLQLVQWSFTQCKEEESRFHYILAATFYADVASARLTMSIINTFNRR